MNKKYRRIYIEITNVCNLSCSFCPIDQRAKDVMELKEFEKIISQAAPLAEQVCLHLMGEPLAHPQFKEILSTCENYDSKAQITTNGILLKRHKETLLSSNAVRQINVSLQSYMDNFPHKNFMEYLDKVYAFIEDARAIRPDLYLNLRLWNFGDSGDEKNDAVFEYLENKLNTQINRKVEVGAVKSKKIAEKLYLHFDSRFEWPRMELPVQGEKGRCNGLKDHLAIHADGTVVPCCLDDQKISNLGNCLETSLEEVIESDRSVRIKEGFSKGVLVEDLCKRCSYINRFKK
ncbi:MAG: radical SAM protein [Halobacteriovoraceae bacterium]|nr:radical SAM protein [Halobacteriovoraceae bacterium]